MAVGWPNALYRAAPPAQPADPYDYSGQYNTSLTPEQEQAFQVWAKNNNRLRDLYDYDLRGAWLSGAQQAGDGHFPDDFKKPNHPTFSAQSRYSGQDGWIGGAWGQDGGAQTFQPGPTNMMSRGALEDYFRRAEPGNRLLYPRGNIE